MNYRLLIVLIPIWIPLASFAQELLPMVVPVVKSGRMLSNPWVGGFNTPQLAAVDLNRDGLDDLYVFDREGNVQSAFLTVSKNGKKQYEFNPGYTAKFPELENWVLPRDYNGDNIPDLFAYSDILGIDGISVYSGEYKGDTLAFKRFPFRGPFGLAPFPLNGSVLTPIYVSKVDLPAVDDIDCDGDIDLLTFNLAGGYAELFQNQSVERGYGLDSLVFTLQNNCWGGFYESGLTEKVDLAPAPGACFRSGFDDLVVNYRHAGSTSLTLDMDGDGDKELILGDVSYNNLNYLRNGGSCKVAWMDQQDNQFPSSDTPVDLPLFPAAFSLDLDFDGAKDLAVSPSSRFGSENYHAIWFYKNIGTASKPAFRLQQKDFLIDQMIDLGTGANPTLADVNGDGLFDLVVGNQSLFSDGADRNSSLALYLNVGSATEPVFEWTSSDWLNFSALEGNSFGFCPSFGDLDQDGDLDLVVGEEAGRLLFAENVGGAGKAMQFGPVVIGYQNIDVGLASVPQVVDLDGDGLPDLVIGERSGNVNFYRNIGSKGNPAFETIPSNAFLGAIDTRAIGYVSGYSAPAVFRDGDQTQFLCGTEDLGLQLYRVSGPDLAKPFVKASFSLPRKEIGFNSRPALADLNSDGFLDLVVGNNRGGLQLYQTPWKSSPATAITEQNRLGELGLFPNPARSEFRIQFPEASEESLQEAALFDIQGRQVRFFGSVVQGQVLSLQGIAPGYYVFRAIGGNNAFISRLVVE
ncbi:MAG: T9SS type A sorting domain-containing protein [Haliscomenobacter sp.]|nr:T9SS type A sorting domain-containing protein [Haliscomenobacter sp.]